MPSCPAALQARVGDTRLPSPASSQRAVPEISASPSNNVTEYGRSPEDADFQLRAGHTGGDRFIPKVTGVLEKPYSAMVSEQPTVRDKQGLHAVCRILIGHIHPEPVLDEGVKSIQADIYF